MNVIRATRKLLMNTRMPFAYHVPTRGKIYLDRDWEPGPYPKTEAERLAAAKKYNLLPEEYQAYDPEKWDFAYGDYPQLPNICHRDKDPYHAWDYPMHRTNYGEPFHVHFEIYGSNGMYLNYEEDVTLREILLVYAVCMAFVAWTEYVFRYKYEKITRFKPQHRLYPGETYYHYPNSKLSAYD